jgi:hypothetical protein
MVINEYLKTKNHFDKQRNIKNKCEDMINDNIE